MSGWGLLAQAAEDGGATPQDLARDVSTVLVVVAILVVVLLGLAAVALVLMMGGRLRRRVQDGVPAPESPPDPMWPLQVQPDDDENRGDE